MIRVVLDTNVTISAIIFGGKPKTVLEAAIKGEVRLCISEEILNELNQVLKSPKFSFPLEIIQSIVNELLLISDLIVPSRKIIAIESDPADNMILECDADANVDYIVTGDSHLLKLGSFENIEIITSARFIDEKIIE